MVLATAIFVAALAAIAIERAVRTKVALVGAALVVITHKASRRGALPYPWKRRGWCSLW